MTGPLPRRLQALAWGGLCHGSFLLAVGTMGWALYTGLDLGLGRLHGAAGWLANGLLVAQFPLLHSFLLGRRGRRWLPRLVPGGHGRTLAPTTYVIVASAQLLATFLLWSPSGVLLWEPQGVARALHVAAFAGAWLFLGKAILDAGAGLQSGFVGWSALWRGDAPRFPGLPERGLFAACRQPIYLGFALVLWTAPRWTLDHLVLALAWGAYCVVGPIFKERRFEAAFGAAFVQYRARVPYFVPRLFR